ncbi:TetR/AcrR family transcriptional regulator [Flavimobilis marinus]|nr:TetR/AcrR family transcriptional regulator [Flavimobilis marinus]
MAPSKRERTRERLAACALELFERQGFERTTVAEIAAVAGVSEMTFFRHFPTKEAAVTTDPFDPVLAAAIALRPTHEPPLVRVARAVRDATRSLPELAGESTRRRVRVVSSSPALRAAATRANEATETAIRDQLVQDGTAPSDASVAAAATLAALTAALYDWAGADGQTLAGALASALRVLGADDD